MLVTVPCAGQRQRDDPPRGACNSGRPCPVLRSSGRIWLSRQATAESDSQGRSRWWPVGRRERSVRGRWLNRQSAGKARHPLSSTTSL